jgi:NAD-dependent deacetylase
MSRNPSTRKGSAQFDHLMELLNARGGVCIVGYGLDAELSMPQFADIIRGVWASSGSNLNPFASADHRRVMQNWINWRRSIIRKFMNAPAYQMLGKLKQGMELVLATQCPDGLGGLNGLSVEFELYGNVFQAKCQACGHEERDWPIATDFTDDALCHRCGGYFFPNAQMFGWNKKAEAEQALIHRLKDSKLAVLIGVDKGISPFDKLDYALPDHIGVIEIVKNSLIVMDGAHESRLSGTDMDHSRPGQKKESATVQEMLGYLCEYLKN